MASAHKSTRSVCDFADNRMYFFNIECTITSFIHKLKYFVTHTVRGWYLLCVILRPLPGVPAFWPEPQQILTCELALTLRLFLRSGCSDSPIMAATTNPALSPATQEQLKWQHAAK